MAIVSPPPDLNTPERMEWMEEIEAYYYVTKCDPGSGLQAVCGVGYDVVSECVVCICAQPEQASFESGWLKVLWDVFIDPEWREPELLAKEYDAELKGASNDFVIGFFLGILRAQKLNAELQKELIKRLPRAVLRINSSRRLTRHSGCGRHARIDYTDWKDWMKGTEEGIK